MTTSTELTLPQRAAVALNAAEHEQNLIALVKNSETIKEIKNLDGRTQCHSALMTLKNARVSIEKTGKAAREDATAFSKAVIAEEKRLLGITQSEEDRLQSLRDKWDADREAERQAAIAVERARVDAIESRLNAVRNMPLSIIGKSSADISQMIFNLAGASDSSEYADFSHEYESVRLSVLDQLAKAETAQIEVEFEAKRIQQEREELARLRAEADAQRIEDERKLAEQRAIQEAELKAERDRAAAIAAEYALLKAAQDKFNAEQIEVAKPTEIVPQKVAPIAVAEANKPARPTDSKIIEVLALHFRVHESKVIEWLFDMDLIEASNELESAF